MNIVNIKLPGHLMPMGMAGTKPVFPQQAVATQADSKELLDVIASQRSSNSVLGRRPPHTLISSHLAARLSRPAAFCCKLTDENRKKGSNIIQQEVQVTKPFIMFSENRTFC